VKKPADLRAHLMARVPSLAADPDKLLMYVERGAVASRLGGGMSFEYRYDLVLLVTDYADHADSIIVPLLAWISINQPDLMQHPERIEQAIRFEAELIDHDKVDLQLTIALTESVVVVVTGGGHTATHIAPPALDDLTGPTGCDLYIDGVQVDQ
jgi:hypothetical protein